jgi:transcription termination factor Rho
MSVLDRDALEGSPLADLHLIASELGLDGYRRLRKADLIDAILTRQGGEPSPAQPGVEVPVAATAEEPDVDAVVSDAEIEAVVPAPDVDALISEAEVDALATGSDAPDGDDADTTATDDGDAEEAPRRRRRGRGGRGSGRGSAAAEEIAEAPVGDEDEPDEAPAPARGRRADADPDREDGREERTVTGTVELLSNGSGFVRLAPPEPSEEDVYVSAAQVRRCELVSGDEVSGPVRAPRRSERYPSLVRVETINGRPADEVAEGTRFEELPVAYPQDRFKLGSEDPTVKAIEFLTPFGRGSRVLVTGGPRAGKTETLSRLAAALAAQEGLEISAVLIGVRPEEIAEWEAGPVAISGTASFAASPDVRAAALERAIEHAQRIAARGGDAVVLVDTLDDLPASAARRALAAARNLRDGGSLTILATAGAELGGETTVIALDAQLASTRTFPALDLTASGTIRPELLVGEAGAEAIATARSEAVA